VFKLYLSIKLFILALLLLGKVSLYPSLKEITLVDRLISTILLGLAKQDCDIFSRKSFSASNFLISPVNSPIPLTVTIFNLCDLGVVIIYRILLIFSLIILLPIL